MNSAVSDSDCVGAEQAIVCVEYFYDEKTEQDEPTNQLTENECVVSRSAHCAYTDDLVMGKRILLIRKRKLRTEDVCILSINVKSKKLQKLEIVIDSGTCIAHTARYLGKMWSSPQPSFRTVCAGRAISVRCYCL